MARVDSVPLRARGVSRLLEPADQVPDHDSPVMVSDYSTFGHASWWGVYG